MQRVPYVHAGAAPPAEEILKQCVLRPGMEDDKTYSHLANMMVFYEKDDTEYKKSVPSRRAAIRGSPVQVVVNHFNVSPSDYTGMTFLGVTRDHLKDGKSAKTHASAAGMFSVCVDGIVTIIQPKDHLHTKNARLGQYVSVITTGGNERFMIKDKHMIGRTLDFFDTPASTAIGRVVEMRSDDVDEVRVKLLPFGPRRPTEDEKVLSNINVERDKKFNAGITSTALNEAKKIKKTIETDAKKTDIMIAENKIKKDEFLAANASGNTPSRDAFDALARAKKTTINDQLAEVNTKIADLNTAINDIKAATGKSDFTTAKDNFVRITKEIRDLGDRSNTAYTEVLDQYTRDFQSETASSMVSTSAPMSTTSTASEASAPMSTSTASEASAAMDTSTSSNIQ